ncbi:MAG: nucleotide pyrophosphohydrolase [bacterium]
MRQDIIKKIIKFRNDRNWEQFHNPKDLAISISIEANELLEIFQWETAENVVQNKIDNIRDELADILTYSILFADKLDIDIEEAILEKLAKNEKKYPIEKAYGSNKKYNEFD